ncbi:hypothetical protein QYH69_29065 [Paraburkholderia sp. SARCC-3016]|uniref:hypothetical protein n=1 Tax=Paraburkholderia sp. SARCC-3016 TaxID=3058611 RepID=UPI0028091A7C|nr:hypothetical protein [Paraburkholderia sp. SARCC-3016]MDQ7981288.1 hypothetical protein [Paraburkholderia sp. SARCC-3016]
MRAATLTLLALLIGFSLSITVALSLALIADIDSPRAGLIRVQPLDLTRLLQSLTK